MFKYIESRINDVHIKKKILILFVIGILIPITILSMFFSYLINSELSHREETLAESELTRMQMNITTMVNTANSLASTYFNDKDLSWALETYNNDSKDSLTVIRKIDSQVLSYQMVHPFIDQLNIYFENTNLFELSYAHFLNSKTKQTDWYKEFASNHHSTFLGVQTLQKTKNLYLIKSLNLLNSKSANFIKIDLSPNTIQSYFASEFLAKENCGIYLVNCNGEIAVSNNSNAPLRFESLAITSNNRFYEKAFDDNSLLNGWKLMVISDQGILYSTLNNRIQQLILIFLIIILISMLLFYGLAHSIISRLENIAWVMDHSHREELTKINIDMGSDEIGITAMHYNRMIERLSSLMAENIRAYDDLQATNEELMASIDEIESKEKQIVDLVYKDNLTGLDNRFAITRFIDDQIDKMITDDHSFCVGFFDIDNFKLINDTYGHDVGDDIIRKTGLILNCFESEHIHIGRFGGDEFIITIKDFKGRQDLMTILNNIRLATKENIEINGIIFSLTISIGASLYAIHSKERPELIKLADIALYKAKELGRDQIVFFEDSMNEALAEKLKQQVKIKNAIKEKQFILFYQPYYNVKTQKMQGCEALIRWKDTCDLNMTPQQLIQNIEEMGLMIEFGSWIFTEACLFSNKLNNSKEHPIVVAINISALQLMHPDFVDNILNIIESNQVNVQHISLEVTESILMNSIEKGLTMLHRLRNAGLAISLDDFGTGHSSLKYFKELPITTLKIDKSFIDHIFTKEYDFQLVETMINLAHNRNIQVIAEGVETLEQLNLLNTMDCDIVQGYYFSKPISETALIEKSIE